MFYRFRTPLLKAAELVAGISNARSSADRGYQKRSQALRALADGDLPALEGALIGSESNATRVGDIILGDSCSKKDAKRAYRGRHL